MCHHSIFGLIFFEGRKWDEEYLCEDSFHYLKVFLSVGPDLLSSVLITYICIPADISRWEEIEHIV